MSAAPRTGPEGGDGLSTPVVDDGPVATVDRPVREGARGRAPIPAQPAPIDDAPPSDAPGPAEPSQLTVTSEAGAVLLAHIRQQVRQIRAQDLPVRRDAEDAVHKMRVASRRLRSALTTFGPLVPVEVARPLGGELKWLAAELGAVRDAEVMRTRVRSALRKEGGDVADPAARTADAELSDVYDEARDRLLGELDGERYRTLRAELDVFVAMPPLTERAAAPAGTALPELVRRSWKKVRRIVAQADEVPEGPERMELLHDARKAAKRARYAAESVSQVFGSQAAAFAAAMEDVQEALGEHQDSVLAQERLRDLARQTSSTEAAFLYGRLHALEEAGATRSRRHFRTAWKAARRKSVHRWLR